MGEIIPFDERLRNIQNFVNDPKVIKQIRNALPSHITPEKMARVFLTACTTTPKLLECDIKSLMKAVLEASSLGLLPDGVLGHGYILPYGKSAKFIPGFRGLMDMARRSGAITRIDARVVYENDEFEFEYGLEPKLRHVPAQMLGLEPGKFVAVYAVAKFAETGETVFEVMYKDDVEAIRRRSPASGSGPWVTDYIEMARKTIIRRLMKYLPLSPDQQAAVAADEYAEDGVLEKIIRAQEKVEGLAPLEDADAGDNPEEVELPDVDADSVEEEPEFTGKGRISAEEDERFDSAIRSLVDRAADCSTPALAEEMFIKMLGASGYELLSEIRSRPDREKFYHQLREEVESWERLA